MTENKLVAQEFAYFKKQYEKKRDDLFRSFYRSILLACGISFELTYQELENGKRIDFADQHFSRFMNSIAVKQFMAKAAVSKKVFKEFDQYARMKSFTMMGDVDKRYLKLVQAKIAKVYAEGRTEKSKEFRAALSKELDNYGSHYMRLVYQNNIESAAQAVRYHTAMEYKDQIWGFEYSNPGDERSRPEHAAMDGKMFPADHAIWKTWYPPNGHLCRCMVNIITHAMAKTHGYKHSKSWPKLKGKRIKADKGWKGIEDFGKAVDFKKVVEVRKAVEASGNPLVVIQNEEADILERTKNKYERASVVDVDGNVVLQKKGRRSSVGFTQDECDLFEGTYFTHNHPSSSSFSGADVKLCVKFKVKQIRAVAPAGYRGNGVFCLEPDYNQNIDLDELARDLERYHWDVKDKVDNWFFGIHEDKRTDEVIKRAMYAASNGVLKLIAKKYKMKYWWEAR